MLKLEPARAIGVRFDDLGTSMNIVTVDVEHQARIGDIECLEALVKVDATTVQHRAHGAIAQNGTTREAIKEGLGHRKPRKSPTSMQS
jgi:hypothetical protein